MTLKKNFFMVQFIIFIFAFCISVHALGEDVGDTIKIGVIAEMTGSMPSIGKACKNAAELAVKEINDAGGLEVGGKKYKVEILVEDCAAVGDQAAAVANRLINQEKINYIIGPNTSRCAIPVSDVCEGAKVVFITPWSTHANATFDAINNKPKKYSFRACFVDSYQAEVLVKFVLDNLKMKKAAVLYDVTIEHNRDISQIFKKQFEQKGGEVVVFENYTPDEKDLSSQLTTIKNGKPDIILLPNYYTEVPSQIKQAQSLGITVPFIGTDAWSNPDILSLCGEKCDGYYFSAHYAPDAADPAAVKYINSYEKIYGTKPDDVAALTYDSFRLLFNAIKKAEKLDKDAVRDSFSKMEPYEGVTGRIKYGENSGDPIKSSVIIKIKEGKFTWFANVHP